MAGDPRRPRTTGPAGELDELLDQWTHDRALARERTLEAVRVGHIVMGPFAAAGVAVAFRTTATLVIGAVYLAGMALALFTLPRRWRAPAVGVFDLLLIGYVSSTDPAIWVAMLVPVVAAMSIGWLVSAHATWVLWGVGVVTMSGAGLAAGVASAPFAMVVLAATSAMLHRNNLAVMGESRQSVLRVADLVDSLPVIVWEAEPGTFALTRAIGRVPEMVGFGAAEWRELPLHRRVHLDDLAGYPIDPDPADPPLVREVRLRCADGSTLRAREVVRAVEVAGRRFVRGVVLGIAEEAAAREAVERLAAVVAHQSEPLLVVRPAGSGAAGSAVVQMNPAFATLAGVDADAAVGTPLSEVAPWLAASVRADLDDVARTGHTADRDDVEMHAPGGLRTFDTSLVALPDGTVGIELTDVTERKHATELIRHQAFHDPLTGLPNRTLLFDRLGHALAVMQREHASLGLLLLDLNQFKEINDTLGHGHGDELLMTVGMRLHDLLRDVDTVARLGGDEFALVVGGADQGSLAEIADRVNQAVRTPVQLGDIAVEVTASIGGVVAPMHGTDPHLLLQRADIAMYDSKRSGMPYRLYVHNDERHSRDRLTLMSELRSLLDDGLRVWFQPKIDLRTGRADSMEALARWQHPRLGLLGPAQFIELCEVSGVISALTYRVLEESLATIREWPGQRVAVNVPVRNLYDRSLPAAVASRLVDAGVDADRLILEITEREIMDDHRAVADVLRDLHDQGVHLAIDDFGTGFSSLTHLRKLPIDEIKIDRSFVAGMLDRENDYIIARSIIDLAHNLGHRVVAEGVEDTATLQLLRGLGCDHAQGFLFARPGPAERIRRQVDAGPALSPEGELAWNRID